MLKTHLQTLTQVFQKCILWGLCYALGLKPSVFFTKVLENIFNSLIEPLFYTPNKAQIKEWLFMAPLYVDITKLLVNLKKTVDLYE